MGPTEWPNVLADHVHDLADLKVKTLRKVTKDVVLDLFLELHSSPSSIVMFKLEDVLRLSWPLFASWGEGSREGMRKDRAEQVVTAHFVISPSTSSSCKFICSVSLFQPCKNGPPCISHTEEVGRAWWWISTPSLKSKRAQHLPWPLKSLEFSGPLDA